MGTQNRTGYLLTEAVASQLLMTADHDALVDEGRAYADKLRAQGVPVRYICAPGQIHIYWMLGRFIPEAGQVSLVFAN